MNKVEPHWNEEELAQLLDHNRGDSEDLQTLLEQLRSDADDVPTDLLTQRIMDATENAPRRHQPLLAIAAAILLLFCTLLMFERGPKERQLAINGGIDWLVSQQEADGHWDPAKAGGHPAFTRGVTALALMAILDSGRTTRFSASIQAARGALLQTPSSGSPHQAFSYNECLATLALLELHKHQPDETLHQQIDRALIAMVGRQNASGGWGYDSHQSFAYQGDAPANSSITVWPLLTLEQAVEQGWSQLEAPLTRARNWMALQVDSEGYMGYRRPGDHPNGPQTLLAIGILGLPENANDQRGKLQANFLKGKTEKQMGRDYYRSFMAARALQNNEEPRNQLQQDLLDIQGADGSWPAGDHWDAIGGRIGATALASLSLSID